MVLNLQKIYQPSDKTYNIVVRNHRDNVMAFCCPNDAEYISFGRWLDAWTKCTEITITNIYGRTASIQMEDDDWHLVISGSIEGGRKAIKVGGSRDFDVIFTNDGHIILQCWNNKNWGSNLGNTLDFVLVPFQD